MLEKKLKIFSQHGYWLDIGSCEVYHITLKEFEKTWKHIFGDE